MTDYTAELMRRGAAAVPTDLLFQSPAWPWIFLIVGGLVFAAVMKLKH